MTRMMSLNEQMEELYSMSLSGQRDTNSRDREKMKKMLVKAMKSSLTERQRSCVMLYYFEHLTMQQVGERLGLNQSTVSRHLRAATVKLRKLRAFVE